MFTYFKPEEFYCKCGYADCDAKRPPDPQLHRALKNFRVKIDSPVIIVSGCRCEKHNKDEGGKPGSAHLTGLAVDIKCLYSRDRWVIIKHAIDCGFNRIGVARTFIHLDVDVSKDNDVVWLYD